MVLATITILRGGDDTISEARPPKGTGKPPSADRLPPPVMPDVAGRGEGIGRSTPRGTAREGEIGDPKVASRPPPVEPKRPPVVAAPPPPAIVTPRRVEGGCDLDCMLEAERKAKAEKGTDGKIAAASPPDPAARSVTPPSISAPPVIERPPPVPPGSALPPAAAPSEGPKPEPVAKLKRYPAPNYALLEEPLSIAPSKAGSPPTHPASAAPTEPGARTVFGVESVECSDEGNWIVGYFGFLTNQTDDTAQFSIRQRYAINNYPKESVTTLAELKKTVKLLECSAGNDCKAPRRTIPYAEFLRTRAPPPSTTGKSAVVVPKDKGIEWRCRPEAGICLSRETDHWRCQAGVDAASSTCIGYDPARWWCVPRREFCYQTVPFGDWGSPHREGSVVTVRLRATKDASGQSIEEDHVYDMSHGIISIAQDVLMRRCAGHSGPAREWRASWFNQSAN